MLTEPPRGRSNLRLVIPVLFVACVALAGASCTPRPQTYTVIIDSTRYQPSDLALKVGDTVVWQNNDLFPHTATATGLFDSGSIAPDRSWRYTVKERGVVQYVCTLHPTMTGTLRVE
jgi:plastocyanin